MASTRRSPLLPRALTRGAVLAAALLALLPGHAWGHAAFLDSSPEPGTRLEAGPSQVQMTFTEPLNRALTEITLVNAATGDRVPAQVEPGEEREVLLQPGTQLSKAAYRIHWHTVSTVDGHALEGSFSFGVRTAAVSTEHTVEQSPLARGGLVRIGFRALLYGTLFFFAGGVFAAALLSRRGGPAGWLAPKGTHPTLRRAGRDPDALADRIWRRSVDAGWLAAGAAAAVALVEAIDAGGGLSLQSASDFLLTNTAGLARVGTVVAVGIAAALAAARLRVAASTWLAIGFLTISFSGHANSASPSFVAVSTDWIHLLAAAVWIGGTAQIAVAWLPLVPAADRELRRAVMRSVLARFGGVALPAFLLVAWSGLTNALIQLGHVDALWGSAYGRVLAVKILLVGLIALASYGHALRIRPRLLGANPHPEPGAERRHWRLLSAEPLLAIGVVAAVAALVTFPLPPQQFGEADEAGATAPCDPCPLPEPRAGELAVAEQAGSRIAAFWLRREGDLVTGTLRLLNPDRRPVDAPVSLESGNLEGCGVGCWRFAVTAPGERITATVEEDGEEHRAAVSSNWDEPGNARARRLLVRAQRSMRALGTLSMTEVVTSGPGTFVRTAYRFRAPDRMAYRTSGGARVVVIGDDSYQATGGGAFERRGFGAGRFRVRGFFRWTVYARTVRWLGTGVRGGRPVIHVALFDPGTPVWYRLTIDRTSGRVLAERMVAQGHFMRRAYAGFERRIRIEPPR